MEIEPIKKIISEVDIITKNVSWYLTVNKIIKKIEINISSISGQIWILEDNVFIEETAKFISLINKLEYEYTSKSNIHIRFEEKDDGFYLYLNGKSFEKEIKKKEKINKFEYIEALEDNLLNKLSNNNTKINPFKDINLVENDDISTPFD